MSQLARQLQQALQLQRQGRLADAERLYRQVLKQKPDHPDALHLLGVLIADAGHPDKALPLLKRATEVSPRQSAFFYNYANALRRSGALTEAVAAYEKAIAIQERSAPAWYGLAHAREQMHELDAARAAVEKALAIKPDMVLAEILAAKIDLRDGDAESAHSRLEALCARDLPVDLRCQASVELGRVLDRLQRYDEAYAAFDQGQRAQMEHLGRNQGDPYSQLIQKTVEWVRTPAFAQRSEASAALGRSPIFFVGFPRSGTTMTEQILAAHPQVRTSDEQPGIHRAIMALPPAARQQYPAVLNALTPPQLEGLRQVYWRTMDAGPDDNLYVDKLPLNLIHLPMIQCLFPGTKVIVALRDPRDVCLSCFMQSFGINQAMAHFLQLESTVAFYQQVMSLFLEMEDRLQVPVLRVRYEDTVDDLESSARRLLEFLDLPWDDQVLQFHEAAKTRYVSTPSYEGVIQPVYRTSIGRWRNYADQFAAHQARLAPYLAAFGYEADGGPTPDGAAV